MTNDEAIPAFPSHGSMGEVVYEGMALRDYFAAKAMAAMISKSHGQDNVGGKKGVPLIAQYSYEFADAMLEERGK